MSMILFGAVQDAFKLIRDERQRQIRIEGFTPEYDHAFNDYGNLILAAASYEMEPKDRNGVPHCWPYKESSWKPGEPTTEGRIRELVKAGALYMAASELMELQSNETALKYAVCEKMDLMAEKIAWLMIEQKRVQS